MNITNILIYFCLTRSFITFINLFQLDISCCKALISEVGEGVSLASVISGGGNWRGRAQQIQALQQRLSEITGKVSNSNSCDTEASEF